MELNFPAPEYRTIRFLRVFAFAIIASVCLSITLSQVLWTPLKTPLAGGETTVFNRTSQGFGQPAPNLTDAELALHTLGDRAFEATFVTSPAPINAGLGPQFNNVSCIGCHLRDGRGMATKGSLLVRVSLPPKALALTAEGKGAHSASLFQIDPKSLSPLTEASVSLGNAPPVPGLGTQIQDQAIYGVQPKATVAVEWQEQSGTYGDGLPYRLRSPRLDITLPDGQPLPKAVLTSLRLPPPVFGRGLLEAIPENTILALADANDKNKDGISGKPNRVWDVQQKKLVLGRFGLKANNPNLLQQNAAAYVNDMGITNPLFPDKNGGTEIDQKTLEASTFYTQTLGVPARTLVNDSGVRRGEKLFDQANCSACHIAQLKTGDHPVKAIAHQTIYPYTDLLLHDMGQGLADGRPDFDATGQEWRTPPLWGLGLTQAVLPYSTYLHDGRARTLEESILWHGGEAETSKEMFRTLSKGDRNALVRFLNSL
ncbi:MAG: c-type cytochrome [Thermosynechococcaceae cyanobacterium MS004]|nr:c-type cytochrome [Thermosynechococcaceae cyanobacterium MS004]